MSLQKEKGLSPQKKNLKPKRESEASGLKALVITSCASGLKPRPPQIANLNLISERFLQIRTLPLRADFL